MPINESMLGIRQRPRGLNRYLLDMFLKRIQDGQLCRGDKLPTEFDLVREYGVSRSAVREAIFAMQVLGLVETRHGAGTFVLGPPAKPKSHPKRNRVANVSDGLPGKSAR